MWCVYFSAWIVEKDYCTSQTGTDGICLDITDCKIFYDYVRENSFTNKVKQTILKYRCGRPSSQKVCCPYKVPPELERPKTLDFTKHANYNLLPTRCGITQTNKITNGNETNLFDYPWAVAIKYNIRKLFSQYNFAKFHKKKNKIKSKPHSYWPLKNYCYYYSRKSETPFILLLHRHATYRT